MEANKILEQPGVRTGSGELVNGRSGDGNNRRRYGEGGGLFTGAAQYSDSC